MKTTRSILESLAAREISVEEAEKKLLMLSLAKVEELAVLDLGRADRAGVPEVIYGQTKEPDQLVRIVERIVEFHGVALITRANKEKVEAIKSKLENVEVSVTGKEGIMTVLVKSEEWTPKPVGGKVAIMTAGTSDIPYAREAEAIIQLMGVEVMTFIDVGIAGIHRLVEPIKAINEGDVDAVVVLAGMEGALPTVVASLVDVPVIGVPIPTGYGHGGLGETALSSMLQSCAPGLAVVNIGNGLGAGAIAALIALRCQKRADSKDDS